MMGEKSPETNITEGHGAPACLTPFGFTSRVITATTGGLEVSILVSTKTEHTRYGSPLKEKQKPF